MKEAARAASFRRRVTNRCRAPGAAGDSLYVSTYRLTGAPCCAALRFGGAAFGLSGLFPAWAQTGTAGTGPALPTLSGEDIRLTIGHSAFTVGGRAGHAMTINGTLPAPLIRLREGQNVRIAVTNTLDEDTSIHWHGLILPFQMDGVPGVSFPGIRPGETFVYEFPIRQSGTYWYHSHSGLAGAAGPLRPDRDRSGRRRPGRL